MSAQKAKYFAYGSNMDVAQMKRRCPSAVLLGSAVLREYRLSFTAYSSGWQAGAADIVSDPNHEVWGLLYLIDVEDMDELDVYEGHPHLYQRVQLSVLSEGRRHDDTWTYEVVQKLGFQPPKRNYLDIMIQAARHHHFPQEYLDSLQVVDCAD